MDSVTIAHDLGDVMRWGLPRAWNYGGRHLGGLAARGLQYGVGGGGFLGAYALESIAEHGLKGGTWLLKGGAWLITGGYNAIDRRMPAGRALGQMPRPNMRRYNFSGRRPGWLSN